MATQTLDWMPATHEDMRHVIGALNLMALESAGNIQAVTNFTQINELVKAGAAEELFPPFHQFSVQHSVFGNIIWDVIGHNHDPNIHAANLFTMTMQMHYCLNSLPFDAIEAAVYAENALPAGTYHFKLLNWDVSYGGGKYVQFTTTKEIPAGGQLVISWPYETSWVGRNGTIYASGEDTTVLETVTLSEGSDGTDLGTADGTGNVNHTQRLRYGSNNASDSCIYQWLNSEASEAGGWYTPSSKWDRPASYISRPGFLAGFDDEFKAALATVSKPNRTNGVFDLHGTTQAYNQESKMFLLSPEEIGFGTESGITCGSVYEYYKDAENADRIKFDKSATTTPRTVWLRCPLPSHANYVRCVSTSGALHTNYAHNGNAVAPACVIGN